MKKQRLNKASTKHRFKKISPAKFPAKRRNYYDLLGLLIVIGLGIIIYSNSFNCSFQIDDNIIIVTNDKIHNISDIPAWSGFFPTRPVAVFTFALNYYFNQLNVWGYHFVNLLIHIINACLVWWLTMLIFKTPVMKDKKIVQYKNLIAFVTALMFVSHPLTNQAVTYISQRMASLVAMFYFLSVALYIKGRLYSKTNLTKYLLFSGTFISAILAVFTKENSYTLPFAILLVELFFIRTKEFKINSLNYRLLILIGIIAGIFIITLLRFSFSIFKPINPQLGHTYYLTPYSYLLTQFSVIVKYIQLLILPINQMFDYDFPLSYHFFEIRTVLSFALLLAIFSLAILMFKKHRIISFGICWFFLTLLIESGFIPLNDVLCEYRTYLPSFGFLLILSSLIFSLLWNKYKFAVIAIFALIIVSNSYLTYNRNKVWKTELSLWSDNVAKAPGIARPVSSRGYAWLKLEKWDLAIADFTNAIEIDPRWTVPYSFRSIAYVSLLQWDKSVSDCSKVIEIDSNDFKAYSNRGIAYRKLGKYKEAINDYTHAIKLKPGYSTAYSNRGVVYATLNQWSKAIYDYNKAISLDSNYADAYYNRGLAYSSLKQYNKAIADYSKTISINPDYSYAWSGRGLAYTNLVDWKKAVPDFEKAIATDAGNIDAYSNLGYAYFNLMEFDKAINSYNSLIKIDPSNTQAYVNRGIAYGKSGQWNKAIDDFTKAIQIDPNFNAAYTLRNTAYKNLKVGV